MRPVLFRLGDVAVPSYGALLVLGAVVAVAVATARARRYRVRRDDVLALGALALGGGLLGGYLLFVLTNLPDFLREPSLLWRMRGMVFYGGLVGGAGAAAVYAHLVRLPLGDVADLVAPALPFGHAVGRLGCFLAGCCFGRPSDGPLAVRLPAGFRGPEAAPGTPVHPVQLYEAAGLLLLGLLLLVLEGRTRRRPYSLALVYLAGYSALRFVVELFRGDRIRGFLVPGLLSTSQAIALLVGGAALGLLLWGRLRDADSPPVTEYNQRR